MSPKIVDKESKIKELAWRALPLFAQKGYAATSVGEIAGAGGIGKGTIYEYFDNKEEIFAAAIMEWLQEGVSQLEALADRIFDPLERLKAFVRTTTEVFNIEDPDTVKLFIEINQQTFVQGGVFSKRRHLMKKLRTGVCRLLVEILLDGVSKRVFRPEIASDADKIAVNLLAFMDGIWMHYLITENFDDYQVYVDFYLKELIVTLLSVKENGDEQIKQSSPTEDPECHLKC